MDIKTNDKKLREKTHNERTRVIKLQRRAKHITKEQGL